MNFEAIFNLFGSLTFRQAIWLFPPVFALHVLEEAPQFTAWVKRYASPKFTQADFVKNNVMGMAIGIVFCLIVSLLPNRITVFLFFVTGINQSILNTFFHIGTTAAYGTYSPGLITSLSLYPALFYYLSRLAYQQDLISTQGGIIALAISAMIHMVVVAKQVYFVKFHLGRKSERITLASPRGGCLCQHPDDITQPRHPPARRFPPLIGRVFTRVPHATSWRHNG